MSPDDYNHEELIAGRITSAHITELTAFYQAHHNLTPDGKLGPATRQELHHDLGPTPNRIPALAPPMPVLPDGRQARVTSNYRPKDRPNHDGCDFFYPFQVGDHPAFVGDKGGATKKPDGSPKWVVPYGVCAIAAADGVVQMASDSKTGYRIWVDHNNGWRTGYFHLIDLKVHVGQVVISGQPLGLVGDNPIDHDGRHLHFELSPMDRYAPIDPEPYITVRR